MSQALFKAAESFLGHRKGGVAMAAIGACAGFGAICGSSLATAATMSRVALPEMRKYGYSGGFSTATLAAGGTLGILIPPSVVLVIYAILTEQNIAKLFLAAFIPGVLAALGYVIVISIYVRLYPKDAGITRERIGYAARLRALIDVWPVLIIFSLVVGGIYLGWFTPTEGAAVGALGTGVIAWVNGGLTRATLGESFVVTARATAMIFFIVLGAAFYNGFLALTQVPQEIAMWVGNQGFSPWLVMLVILVFYLLLGCLMDSLSMILLTIPIFWPVILGLDFGMVTLAELHADRALAVLAQGVDLAPDMLSGIQAVLADGVELTREQIRALGLRGVSEVSLNRINTERVAIWFGILVLIVVEVGLITPPVGMNLFIINAMDRKTPMVETYKAVLFFVASDIVRIALLFLFPAITLVLIPW
jgi:tripartite ATP-independent transporter DctM subunit